VLQAPAILRLLRCCWFGPGTRHKAQQNVLLAAAAAKPGQETLSLPGSKWSGHESVLVQLQQWQFLQGHLGST